MATLKLKKKYVQDSPDPGNSAIVNFIEDRKINPRTMKSTVLQDRLKEQLDEQARIDKAAKAARDAASWRAYEADRLAAIQDKRFNRKTPATESTQGPTIVLPTITGENYNWLKAMGSNVAVPEVPVKTSTQKALDQYKTNVGDSKNIFKKFSEGTKAAASIYWETSKALGPSVPLGVLRYVKGFDDWFYSGLQDIKNTPENVSQAWDKYRTTLGASKDIRDILKANDQFLVDTQKFGAARRLVNAASPDPNDQSFIGKGRAIVASTLDAPIKELEKAQGLEDEGSFVTSLAGGVESLPYSGVARLGVLGWVMNFGTTQQSAKVTAYQRLLEQGKEITDQEAFYANVYSTGAAVVEATSEMAFPLGKATFSKAITALGATKAGLVLKAISKLPGATAALGGTEEAAEEWLSAFGTGLVAKITIDPKAPYWGTKEEGALVNMTDLESASIGAFFIAAVTQGVVDTFNYKRTQAAVKKLKNKPNITKADTKAVVNALAKDGKNPDAVLEIGKKVINAAAQTINKMPESTKADAIREEIDVQKAFLEGEDNPEYIQQYEDKIKDLETELTKVVAASVTGAKTEVPVKQSVTTTKLRKDLASIRSSLAKAEESTTIQGVSPEVRDSVLQTLKDQEQLLVQQIDTSEAADLKIKEVKTAERQAKKQVQAQATGQTEIVESGDPTDRVIADAKAQVAAQEQTAVTLPATEPAATAAMPTQEAGSGIQDLAPSNVVTDVQNVQTPSPALQTPSPEPWQMTQTEYVAASASGTFGRQREFNETDAKKYHEYAVRNAILSGENVPADVLAEYPDLVVPAVTETQPAKKINKAVEPVAPVAETPPVEQTPIENIPEQEVAPVEATPAEGENEFAVPEMTEANKRRQFAVPNNAEVGDLVWTDNGDGTRVLTAIVRMPLDTLIGSMDEQGNKNAAFPEEYQPRDTDRESTKRKIADIAQNPTFGRVSGTNTLQEGTIVAQMHQVGGKMRAVAIAGNHRLSGFLRMRQDFKENFRKMRNFWNARYRQDGFSEKTQKDELVVVRLVPADANGPALAALTNKGGVTQYSASENARADAQKIDTDLLRLLVPSDSGSYATEGNKEFVRAFVNGVVPENERNMVVDGSGNLSSDGETRIRNAIFYKAYDNMDLVAALSEKLDIAGMKNLIMALNGAAPKFVELNPLIKDGSVYSIPITETVGEAASQVAQILKDPKSVVSRQRQTRMGEDDVYIQAQKIAKWLQDNNSSYVRMQGMLENLADSLRAKGDPRETGLMMLDPSLAVAAPTLSSLVNEVLERQPAVENQAKKINKKPRAEARKSIKIDEANEMYDYQGTSEDYASIIANMKVRYNNIPGEIYLAPQEEITEDAKIAANIFYKITKLPVVFFKGPASVRGQIFTREGSRLRIISINVNRSKVGRAVVSDLLSSMGHEWFHVAQLNGQATEMVIAMAKTMRMGIFNKGELIEGWETKMVDYAVKNYKVSRNVAEAWQKQGILMDEVFARRSGELFKSEYFWTQMDVALGSEAGKFFRRIVDSVKQTIAAVKGMYADPALVRANNSIKQFETEILEILKTIERVSKTVDPDTYKTAFLMTDKEFTDKVASEAKAKLEEGHTSKDLNMRNTDGIYDEQKLRKAIEDAEAKLMDMNLSDEELSKTKDAYKRYANILNVQMKNPNAFKRNVALADQEYLGDTQFNNKNRKSKMYTVGPSWRAMEMFKEFDLEARESRENGVSNPLMDGFDEVVFPARQAVPAGLKTVSNIVKTATGVPINYYMSLEATNERNAPLGFAVNDDAMSFSTFTFVDPFYKNQRSVIGTMGHEFFHTARTHGYGYWFERATMDALGIKTTSHAVDYRKESRPNETEEYRDYLVQNGKLVEEILADNASRVFRSSAFWNGLKSRISPTIPWHSELAMLAQFMKSNETTKGNGEGVNPAVIRSMIATMESTLSDTDFGRYTETYNVLKVANDIESKNREEGYPFLDNSLNADKIRVRELSRAGEEVVFSDYEGISDPNVEAKIDAAKDFDKSKDSFASKIKAAYDVVRDNLFRGAVPELATGKYGDMRRFFRRMLNIHETAASMAFAYVKRTYGRLNKNEKWLFDRHVLLTDYARDVRGGITGKHADNSPFLKYGFVDQAQVELELVITTAHLQDPKYRAVKTAVRARAQLFQEVQDTYVAAAKKLGIDMSGMFSHGSDYMHQIIKEIEDDFRQRGVSVPGTAALGVKGRQGTDMDHITDVFVSDTVILEKLMVDISKMEMIKSVKDEDISQNLPIDPVTGIPRIPKGYARATLNDFGFRFEETTIKNYAVKSATIAIAALNIRDPFVIKTMMAQARATKLHNQIVVQVEAIQAARRVLRVADQNIALKAYGKVVHTYKTALLIAPWRVIPYQIKNAASDVYGVLITYPGLFLHPGILIRAVVHLERFYFGHGAEKTLIDYMQDGGLTSGNTNTNREDFRKNQYLRFKDKLLTATTPGGAIAALRSLPRNMWRSYENGINMREQILRYATYLYLWEIKTNNPQGLPMFFGGSNAREIMSIKSRKARCFKLADDALGAFDDVSIFTQALSKSGVIPFARWTEVNIKRTYRVVMNSFYSPSVAMGVGMPALKNAGAGTRATAYAAWQVGKLGLVIVGLQFAVDLWNKTRWPDEEEALPEEIKGQPHIILGNFNGRVQYFIGLNPLFDAIDTLGLGSIQNDVKDVLNGKYTYEQKVAEMSKRYLVEQAAGFAPLVTMPFALATGTKLTQYGAAPIRENWQYFFEAIGAGDEYKQYFAKELPKKQGDLAYIEASTVSSVDLGQQKYYDAYGMFYEWQERMHEPRSDTRRIDDPLYNAAYYFKQALMLGDMEAAKKYLADYYLAGGTTDKMQGKLESMNPLAAAQRAGKEAQKRFMDSLSEDDLAVLNEGIAYYDKILAEGMAYANESTDNK